VQPLSEITDFQIDLDPKRKPGSAYLSIHRLFACLSCPFIRWCNPAKLKENFRVEDLDLQYAAEYLCFLCTYQVAARLVNSFAGSIVSTKPRAEHQATNDSSWLKSRKGIGR
jgi:hypothetical protein